MDEAPGRMKERFGDLDTDGDGFIDEAEMEALMQRFRGGRGGRGGGEGRGKPQRGGDREGEGAPPPPNDDDE